MFLFISSEMKINGFQWSARASAVERPKPEPHQVNGLASILEIVLKSHALGSEPAHTSEIGVKNDEGVHRFLELL